MRVKKYVMLLLTLLLTTGLFATTSAFAAPVPQVGVVDFGYLVDHHPDTAKANEVLKNEQDAAKKEFAEKSATLGDKEKTELDRQLGQKLEQKRLELLKPITDSIFAKVKEVQDAKGLSIVITKREVVSGGLDITEEVLARLAKK